MSSNSFAVVACLLCLAGGGSSNPALDTSPMDGPPAGEHRYDTMPGEGPSAKDGPACNLDNPMAMCCGNGRCDSDRDEHSATCSADCPSFPCSDKPLVDAGDGTLTDAASGLTWQKPAVADKNGQEGGSYCTGLGAGWRLPTIDELKSLLLCAAKEGCWLNGSFGGPCERYWSSTRAWPSGASYVYVVLFTSGQSSALNMFSSTPAVYTRCVKGK